MTPSRNAAIVWIARHAAWASLALVAMLFATGYLSLFRHQIAGLRQADQTARLHEEREKKDAYLRKLDALAVDYATIDPEDVERARAMLPREEDIPGILAMLEAAAQGSDVQLTAVNFSAGDVTGLDLPNVGALSVSISLQHGNYQRFKLFLEALQDNLRLFDVRSANINPSGASYALTIRAYVWKNPS